MLKSHLITYLITACLIIIASVIGVTPVQAATPEPSWNPTAHFKLVMDDEFNGTSVNTNLWNTGWYGTGITGPVNSNETVRYNSANVTESGGYLNLALNAYGALVDTNGHFSLTYGRVEWRACLPPSASGQIADWPALWLDGQPVWPAHGEIDVLEGLGGQAAFHYHSPAGGPGADVPGIYANITRCGTFGVYWVPGTVQFFYDSKSAGQIHQDIQGAPMFLVMDNTAGDGGPPPAIKPAMMRIDWIRIWAY